MPAGTTAALTVLRVPAGAPPPDRATLEAALARDRVRLGLPAAAAPTDLRVAGPYRVVVDGNEQDEYVVWEA